MSGKPIEMDPPVPADTDANTVSVNVTAGDNDPKTSSKVKVSINVVTSEAPLTARRRDVSVPIKIDDNQVDKLVEELKDLFKNEPMGAASITRAIVRCMKITSAMGIVAHLKKATILTALEKYVKEHSGLECEAKEALLLLVETTGSDIYDTLYDVKKGVTPLTHGCCVLM